MDLIPRLVAVLLYHQCICEPTELELLIECSTAKATLAEWPVEMPAVFILYIQARVV
jgi:hypothetical protein